MEKKIFSFMIVCLVVVGILAGQSTALFGKFGKCYKECLIGCLVPPIDKLCPLKCLKKCIFHPSMAAESTTSRTHQFCKFGCAYSHCSKISTLDEPRFEELESCVGYCSEECDKNYMIAN